MCFECWFFLVHRGYKRALLQAFEKLGGLSSGEAISPRGSHLPLALELDGFKAEGESKSKKKEQGVNKGWMGQN